MPTCPFCATSSDEAWVLSDSVIAIPHQNPITACHMLVAPRRHVPGFYDLDVHEQRLVWSVVEEIRNRIASALKVDGFDVGFAEGRKDSSAHVHIHVVPRTPGEQVELPPGIEWVSEAGA